MLWQHTDSAPSRILCYCLFTERAWQMLRKKEAVRSVVALQTPRSKACVCVWQYELPRVLSHAAGNPAAWTFPSEAFTACCWRGWPVKL